jgi:RNA polymerase sigma-70 factor (ECF subfamily)
VAEELAQEVFLRVYRSRAGYEPTAKFTTWLFRIASHVALNYIRDGKHERHQESLDGESAEGIARQVASRAPTVEQEMVREVQLAEVRRTVELLPGQAAGGGADVVVPGDGLRADCGGIQNVRSRR